MGGSMNLYNYDYNLMSMKFLQFTYPAIYVNIDGGTIDIIVGNYENDEIHLSFYFSPIHLPKRGKEDYAFHISQIEDDRKEYSYRLNSYLKRMLLRWIPGWLT